MTEANSTICGNGRDCEHGQLARSCEICELRRDVAALEATVEHQRRIMEECRVIASGLVGPIATEIQKKLYDRG